MNNLIKNNYADISDVYSTLLLYYTFRDFNLNIHWSTLDKEPYPSAKLRRLENTKVLNRLRLTPILINSHLYFLIPNSSVPIHLGNTSLKVHSLIWNKEYVS